MRVWIDCTSLMGWEKPHLTGIQRSMLGICKGWAELGIEPLFYRYDPARDHFAHLDAGELPELIRINLENKEWIDSDPRLDSKAHVTQSGEQTGAGEDAVAVVPGKKQNSQRLLRALVGEGQAAEDLLNAISATNLSVWKLQKAARTWLRARVKGSGLVSTQAEQANNAESDIPDECLSESVTTEDYFFSIGPENFQIPANVKASQRLRQKGGKLIRMIYDIIPVSQPQWVDDAACDSFRNAMHLALPASDLLLTISDYSRIDLINFAQREGIVHPRVIPIRLGDVNRHCQVSASTAPGTGDQPTRPFLLCVGTIEPRKNHRLLYDCWRRLGRDNPETCPDLVCIGAHHLMCSQLIHEIKLDPLTKERIHLPTEVADGQLQWFYEHCIATVFPSLYEGWGLPVAESLAKGKICLASHATSIPEISSLAVLFDPEDVGSLCELVMRTAKDKQWKNSLEERISTSFKPTTWRETAQQILTAAESLKS